MHNKSTLRAWAKRTRATLEPTLLSPRLCEKLMAWEGFQQAQHILTYLPFGSEFDLTPLHGLKKQFYLTRTWERGNYELTVHKLSEGLEPHPYGYLQPPANSERVDVGVLELVLVPGLAFDLSGTRLGYGLGYYDRLLPKLRPGVPFVGVTAEALVVPSLPHDAFDTPMTHLLTEAGIKVCSSH